METDDIDIKQIRTDGGTQMRAELDDTYIAKLIADLNAGETLPPIRVVRDGDIYWLVDGFHRLTAYEDLDHGHVTAEITDGTQDDAIWLAISANREHDHAGKARSNEDKRRAVEAALNHPNGAKMSDRAIAEWVGVHPTFVGRMRKESPIDGLQVTARVGRDGKTYNVENIGRRTPAAEIGEDDKPAPTRTEYIDTNTGEVLDEIEVRKTKTVESGKEKKRGSYEDWKRLVELVESVKVIADEIATLRMIGDCKLDARNLCCSVAETFTRLSQKVVE